MIKALLFDLDDTLLGNDMGTFIPAYFGQVTRYFPELDANTLLMGLMAGTRAMLGSEDPAHTMRQIFLQNFPPAHNGHEAELWQRFLAFYRTDFAGLRALTTVRPAALTVLEWARAAGYRLVVATSPLFPLEAIHERLRWGGVDDVPFELITHIENCHYAKPHPEYFAEILARLGLRPDEALMVGNDWNDDLAPCAALGLPHFWITPAGSERPSPAAGPVGIGSLEDFLAWAQACLADFKPPAPPPTAIPPQLAGNLAYLVGELADVPADQWTKRPTESEWSLTEIICHLRDVDREVNLPRMKAVLATENPFITGADTDPWAVARNYQAQSGPQALQEFLAARQELHRLLAAQPAEAWSRSARHAFFGPTTLSEITGWILDHDRLHLEQVRATLQKTVPG